VDSHFDLVVIGSGPAGEKAAALAAYHGKRVAVVEKAPEPGGTMVNGVAGSKTMREAALYLTGFRQRKVYGVGLELEPQLAIDGVRGRTKRVQWLLAHAVQDNLDRHGIALVHGTARLAGPGRVEVLSPHDEQSILAAEVILIATGARPLHPAGMPFDHRDVLDSDTAQRLERRMRSVVVVGGGAVACEYASIFATLGSETTLVESGPRLLPFADAEISGLLAQAFEDMGITLRLGAGHARVSADPDGVVVTLADGSAIYPAKVVVAAGRVGNTEELGLAEAGVATDSRGHVLVDGRYATTAPGIFAAGDVIGPPGLASVSSEQGRAAICHAFGITLPNSADAAMVLGVYSLPEVAMVGMTEDMARAAGEDIVVGRARLSRNARTAISGGSPGMVKLLFRRVDRRLLGAHVVGDHATELVHLPQAVLHFGGTVDYFIATTFNTPTASEAFKFAAYDALSRIEERATLTANV